MVAGVRSGARGRRARATPRFRLRTLPRAASLRVGFIDTALFRPDSVLHLFGWSISGPTEPPVTDPAGVAVGATLADEGVDTWFVDQVAAFQELTGEVFGSAGQTNVMVEPEQLPTSYRAVVDPAVGADLVQRWAGEPHVFDALVEPTDDACADG